MSKTLEAAGAKIVEELKKTFVEKDLNDTGKASASIDYVIEDDVLKIRGLKRVLFLEFGREAGTFPPVDVIRRWVESKLGITEEKERNQVAFLIGRKIFEKGTDILTDRSKGLQIELTLEEVNSFIFEQVSEMEAANITNGIFTTWEDDKKNYRTS